MPTPRVFQPTDPGCVEVVFRFKLFGIPLVIVIAVCLDAGTVPTPAQLGLIASKCDNWMEFQMMPNLSVDLLYRQVQVTETSTSTGGQITIDHAGGVPGTVASDSLPGQNAAVFTLYTALRGRNYRGRTFVPGIPVSYITATTQDISAGGTASLVAAYGQLDGLLAAAASHQAVLTRKVGGVRRPVALGNVVTSRALAAQPGTLRRRSAAAHRS